MKTLKIKYKYLYAIFKHDKFFEIRHDGKLPLNEWIKIESETKKGYVLFDAKYKCNWVWKKYFSNYPWFDTFVEEYMDADTTYAYHIIGCFMDNDE
jgi:hypothetical protein